MSKNLNLNLHRPENLVNRIGDSVDNFNKLRYLITGALALINMDTIDPRSRSLVETQ